MADATIIKEFLVALGFEVDQKGLKKFTTGISDATVQVTKLIAVITGAALTVSAGVAAFASNMEGLYFASKRVGASATNIKALEQSATDFGASADEARGSLEGLARFMRNNPAGESWLNSLGVATRDANGQLRDTADILIDIGKYMASQPSWRTADIAGDFGISENFALVLRNGEFEKAVAAKRKALENSGMDKATEDAHKFMIKLREVGQQFQKFGIQVEAALLQKAGPILERFAAWFDKNGNVMSDRLADVLVILLRLLEEGLPVLLKVLDIIVELDAATDGWSTKIGLLTAAFMALGGPAVLGAIASIGTALTGVGGTATGLLGTLKSIGALGAIGISFAVGWKIGEQINEHLSEETKDIIGGTIAAILAKFGNKEAQAALDANLRIDDIPIVRPQKMPTQVKSLAPQRAQAMRPQDTESAAIAFFKSNNWTHEQAAGLVANLRHESKLNPGAVGDSGNAYGIAQWHPDRQAKFAQWAGKNIRQSTLQEQLQFVQYELTKGDAYWRKAGNMLRAAKTAAEAGEVVSRYYERPRDKESEAGKRSASAVQIAQETKIYVQGGANPAETARAVASEQRGVNDDFSRTFQGNVS